ncbi:TPA: hypothetical protein SIA39_002791 [Aeromonas sobria]|jgi:hypothetical protein|nr:hypothetical protein [Aeromonas sobria]
MTISQTNHLDALIQMVLALSDTKKDLDDKFLKPHLNNPTAVLEDFKFDVKSYCVLLHAAIEDFIEGVALSIFRASCDIYLKEGVITIPFMYALHMSGALEKRITEIAEDDVDQKNGEIAHPVSPSIFFMNQIKSAELHIQDLLGKNHGISRKYLKKILMALGVHIEFTDINYSHWKSISEYRGAYAHSDISYIDVTKAKKPLAPEKSLEIGNAAIEFSMKIFSWAEDSLKFEHKHSILDFIAQKEEKAKENEKNNIHEKKLRAEKEALEAAAKKQKEDKKEMAKQASIERVKKLDQLILWVQTKHPEKYNEIFDFK